MEEELLISLSLYRTNISVFPIKYLNFLIRSFFITSYKNILSSMTIPLTLLMTFYIRNNKIQMFTKFLVVQENIPNFIIFMHILWKNRE